MKQKFGPRTRGEMIPLVFGPGEQRLTRDYKNQPSVTTTSSLSYNLGSLASNGDVMHDIVTHNWQKRRAAGEIIVNPMDRVVRWSEVMTSFSGESMRWWHLNPSSLATGKEVSGNIQVTDYLVPPTNSNFPTLPETTDLSYIFAEAVNEAYTNAHQRNVMGLVDVAESGKTFDMLRTQLGRLESVVSQGLVKTVTKKAGKVRNNPRVMRYKSKTAAGQLADASGLWLEVQYGVIPLMLSINGLVKALTLPTMGGDRPRPQTFRGSESSTLTKTLNNTVNTPFHVGTAQNIYTLMVDQKSYARAGVMTRYQPSLRARLGLELRDIVPGAYELIPFSFVYDWAHNLGNYLEAATPVKGFSKDASWVTLHNEVVLQYIFERPFITSTGLSWTYQGSSLYTEFVEGFRTSARIPGVIPRIPSFNSELKSLTHFISGAAIVLSKTLNSKTFRKSLTK